jgi:hypothetical protein
MNQETLGEILMDKYGLFKCEHTTNILSDS